MPQHQKPGSKLPDDGNQVFIDGSARWIKAQSMYFLASWNTTARIAYFYQDDSDFDSALRALLPSLRFKP